MAPEDKKKKKLSRVLRIAVPALLVCAFAALAVFEKNGVFAAASRVQARPVEAKPAPVPVPLTELAVMNRLECDGFSAREGHLTRLGADAGQLSYLRAGETLSGVVYTLVTLPAPETFPGGTLGEEMRLEREADRENAKLVLRAVTEAVLGGEAPTEKQLEQAETKLESCLASLKDKSESFRIGTCAVTLTMRCADGVYTLTVRAERT